MVAVTALAGIAVAATAAAAAASVADSATATPAAPRCRCSDTLAWKLDLLGQGHDYTESLLPSVQQRVLVLVGDGDILIPSAEEGPRLQRALPRAHLRVMKGHSHALLQVREG